MLWFLLVPVVLFYAVKEFVFDDVLSEGFLDRFMGFVTALVIAALAACLSTGAAIGVGTLISAHPVKAYERALVAIRDKDGVEGRFFLGTGTVDSNQYYFYYYRLEDGSFKAGKVRSGDGVRVYEEVRQDATLTVYNWVPDQSFAWIISIPINAGGNSYDFHVPTGTIRRGFTM